MASNSESCDTLSVNQSDAECGADWRVCLVGDLISDSEALEAAQKLGVPVVNSQTGEELVDDLNYATVFVLAEFESKEFDVLNRLGAKILGKPALLEQAIDGKLSYAMRPLFCYVMKDISTVFTGFRRKSDMAQLLRLIHFMGGRLRNEMDTRITHLVAHCSTGEKYQYAVTFGVPVMGDDWVKAAWAHREEIGTRAVNLDQYRLRIFHNLRLVLLGFPEEEKAQMVKLVEQNGGTTTVLADATASHVVLEDQNVPEKPADCPAKSHVVRAEWFWSSITMDACAPEHSYLVRGLNSSSVLSPRSILSPSTPNSRGTRRKRLRETVQQLALDGSPSYSKRRSSVGDLTYLSTDGSILDDTVSTPNKLPLTPSIHDGTPMSPPSVDLRQMSSRHRVFYELMKTECNYVSVLDTICKVIKEPLEDPSQPGGAVLDAQEIRYIFGNLWPIHDVHKRIRNELVQVAHQWNEDVSVGQIILRYIEQLKACYPPFINYFENVKEMLQKVSSERPRFHAFLKLAQNKPECGRQSLQELLIRPVQRLPSVILLISDILKHTDKSSADYATLEEALKQIRLVTESINDNKRETEANLKLFEIHNEIENCPANLVVAQRKLVSKVDTIELSNICCGHGDTVTMFLFSDVLEMCKKKKKYDTLKSPSRANLHTIKSIKTYKHLELMNLSHIKRVIDIQETEDCRNVFAMIIRTNQEVKERLCYFTISPEETSINKTCFLKLLCRAIGNIMCLTDMDNFLITMAPQDLDIDSSAVSTSATLHRAMRFASRTTRKVSRAFSFNSKSPGTKLKRAMSSMLSPFAGQGHLGMRPAASVSNLSAQQQTLTVPTTPPPGERPGLMGPPTPLRRPLKYTGTLP